MASFFWCPTPSDPPNPDQIHESRMTGGCRDGAGSSTDDRPYPRPRWCLLIRSGRYAVDPDGISARLRCRSTGSAIVGGLRGSSNDSPFFTGAHLKIFRQANVYCGSLRESVFMAPSGTGPVPGLPAIRCPEGGTGLPCDRSCLDLFFR